MNLELVDQLVSNLRTDFKTCFIWFCVKGQKGEPATAVGTKGPDGPKGNPGRDGADGPPGPEGQKGKCELKKWNSYLMMIVE